MSTVFFGNLRTTPDPAIALSVSGASGADVADLAGLAEFEVADTGFTVGQGAIRSRTPANASTNKSAACTLPVDLAHVVDHLAVVRQFARCAECGFAAQLGN